MAFKLTYATMFNPPETLHKGFDKAVAQLKANLGKEYSMIIDGKDFQGRAMTVSIARPREERSNFGGGGFNRGGGRGGGNDRKRKPRGGDNKPRW